MKKNVFVIGTDYGNAIHAGVKYAVEKLGKKDARFGLIYRRRFRREQQARL